MNNLKTTVLLAALTGLLMAAGGLFAGRSGVTFMLLVSLIMNFASYWYSDKIVLRMYDAREVTSAQAPDLVQMVSRLAGQANLPSPRVFIIDSDTPNAFATGRSPQNGVVAVTTGILRTLSFEELEGVLSHELAHIKNRDTFISTVVASLAGVITWIAQIAQWGAILGIGRSNERDDNGGLIGTLALVILAPLAAALIQMGISRSREYQADETGAMISGKPLALANALLKIESYAKLRTMPEATPATSHLFIINPFSGSGSMLTNLFSTHPATADRVARLQEIAHRHS
jgi:heat shock protein HtpX